MSESVKLSSPWITYVNKLTALFKNDPEITIKYNDDIVTISLYVTNPSKAKALQCILPYEKRFGETILNIDVIPTNEPVSDIDLFEEAFKGNPAFSFVDSEELFSKPIHYVVFTNKVVQFFNDNLNDINGNISTLYQDIAKEIFSDEFDNIFFCTDLPDDDDFCFE